MRKFTPIEIPRRVQAMADELRSKAVAATAPIATPMNDSVATGEGIERLQAEQAADRRRESDALTAKLMSLPADRKEQLADALLQAAAFEKPTMQRSVSRGLRGAPIVKGSK